MKVLITGGLGYVGSRISSSLKSHHTVYICDLNQTNGRFGDFDTVDISEFDVIIHLAAHSSVKACKSDPNGAWDNNYIKFQRLIHKISPRQLLIHASSASVYGKSPGRSSESQDLKPPNNSYDLTKIVADIIVENTVSKNKVISLRFGTVAGASSRMRFDTVLNSMVFSATNSGLIYANNPKTRRSLLFLSDLELALNLILKTPFFEIKSGIYNLASIDTSVGEIATQVHNNFSNIELRLDSVEDSDYDFHLNCEKFLKIFGEFRVTTLNEVVTELRRVCEAKKDD